MINELVYPGGVLLVLLLGSGAAFWRLSSSFRVKTSILREQQEKLEKTNKELEARLANAELMAESPREEVLSLQGKIYHLEKDLALTQQNLTTKEAENSRLIHQFSHIEQQLVNVRSQFSQLEKFHEQLKTDYQKQVHNLIKEKESLSLKIQAEVSLHADLRNQVATLEKAQKDYQNSLLKLQELEQAQQLWSSEKDGLEKNWRSQLEGLETALNQEKTHNQSLESELTKTQSQASANVAEIQGRLQQLQQQHEEFTDSQSQLERDRQQLEVSKNETETQYQAALVKLESLQKDWTSLQKQEQKQAALLQQEREKVIALEKQLTKSQTTALQLQQEQDRVLALEKQLAKSQDVSLQLQTEREKAIALEQQLAQFQDVSLQLQTEREKAIALEQQLAQIKSLSSESTISEKVDLAKVSQPLVSEEVTSVATPIVEETQKIIPVTVPAAEKTPVPTTPAKKGRPKKVQTPKTETKTKLVEPLPIVSTPEPEKIAIEPQETESPAAIASPLEPIIETRIETQLEVPQPPTENESISVAIDFPAESSPASPKANLQGKNWIILGTLSLTNRDRAKELIQESGGHITSSPSGKTDYAIVGKAPGEKLKKAQKLGISQLSESQFLKLLGVEA